MLQSIFIQNYVLIDSLDILFDRGFSVITGETGAGKSIILGALGLVLGQRADSKSIQAGADKCVLEATFDIRNYSLKEFFAANDLEYDAENCIMRRELFASGKSRAFINDSPVSLSIMKELGSKLIDIHSQHQNLLLGDNRFQLKVVDVMAGNEALMNEYCQSYKHYHSLKHELTALQAQAEKNKQEEDYIRFQLQQLENARLISGEQGELEAESKALSHAEEIKAALYKITELLNGDEGGSVSLLREALTTANTLERYYPKAKEIAERLQTAYIDLGDLASDTDSWKEDIDFRPDRLEWISDRLDTLYSLQQKHHVSTVEELITLRDRFSEQLQQIESSDEQIAAMQQAVATAYKELLQQGEALSHQRKQVADSIAQQLVEHLHLLGMPHVQFVVDFAQRSEPGIDGIDDISFLFTANKSTALQPVAQAASGGEISRLMLCIKAMIAGFTALPAIIFDEVDTGVSGDIADRMGDIMQELGQKMQVIAITHLPQIAAKGKAHYFVYKEDTEERTITRIKPLDKEARIIEVARMLSGASLTDAAIANAKELINLNQKQ